MKRSLKNLIVLFLDCQATVSNAESGQLLEIGWLSSEHVDAGTNNRNMGEAHLVQAPAGTHIPARVNRVTGITDADVACGSTRSEIWKRLRKAARWVARANHMKKCLLVIHFARFELPYVRMLHEENEPRTSFPFEVICTHEIARRLFPELPRRGIRALAGFFGYSTREKRRSEDHCQATAIIWKNMLSILSHDYGIETYVQLKKWLRNTPVRSFASRGYPMKDQYRRHLPDVPGVYRMCRSGKDVLYIGKARSLKKRVNSYFKKRGPHAEHILEMLTQARHIQVIETGSALEAALLESDQIKQYNPPYNVALRRRDREVMFCDTTFTEFVTEPSRRHHVGPLTSRDPFNRLAALRPFFDVAGSEINKNIIQETLILTESYGPGIDSIQEGFELFLERNKDALGREPNNHALVYLGQQLWMNRGDTVIDQDDEEVQDNDEVMWSPENIARAIENLVMHTTHTMRRARLCVLLSESSLAWEEVYDDRSSYTYLVLEKGVITDRGTLPRKKRPPLPRGYKKTFLERQRAFNVSTVDRMRVLITELRRMVNADQWVRVRLRPRVTLDNEQLESIFTWI